MSCNCKKKIEQIDEKYGDSPKPFRKSPSLILKILKILLQIPFGLLCGCIIIVMVVPMLLYVIFCMMFGIEAKFRIINPNKYLKK